VVDIEGVAATGGALALLGRRGRGDEYIDAGLANSAKIKAASG
jgi:hypothetical protein